MFRSRLQTGQVHRHRLAAADRAHRDRLGLRLVKTAKVLLGDTGLLCHLLGLLAARLQADDLMTGAALECFVAGELTKQYRGAKHDPDFFTTGRTLNRRWISYWKTDADGWSESR